MNNKFMISLFFVIIFSLTLVLAVGPGVPHQFYGTATYNGAAANGLTIEAYIGEVKVGSTTTSTGKYGYSPIFYISDPEGNYKGKTVQFYLKGVNTGTSFIFENGASTKLDLLAGTAPTTPQTPTAPPSSGGGGGGSPSGSSKSSTKTCEEDWYCGSWSICIDGKQKRTCTDLTKCGTTEIKPAIQKACTAGTGESEEQTLLGTEEGQGFFSRITGAVIGGGNARFIIPLIFIILIVVISIGIYLKRRS